VKFLKTFFGSLCGRYPELCETFALSANMRRNFHRIPIVTFIEGGAPYRKLLNLIKRSFHFTRQRTASFASKSLRADHRGSASWMSKPTGTRCLKRGTVEAMQISTDPRPGRLPSYGIQCNRKTVGLRP
jgi:hypothetical protein